MINFLLYEDVDLGLMIVAGGLLFGGVVLGLVLLLREPPHIPDHEPPST